MKRNLLYYPTINIPNEDWIRNALIYWDEFSSIVPMNCDKRPVIDLNNNLLFLKDEGFFRPISPDILFTNINYQSIINNFECEFFSIIESLDFEKIHLDNCDVHLIHKNKVSNNLLLELCDRKLLDSRDIHHEWIKVDPKIALLYMSLLAKYIADLDPEFTTIGTDDVFYENLNFNVNSKSKNISCFSSCLNNILPTPTENVSFEKIIDFKKKRYYELLNFRNEICEFEKKVSNSESISEVKFHMVKFSEKIKCEVNELNRCFNDARITTVMKSLRSLINIKSPTFLFTALNYFGRVSNLSDIPPKSAIAFTAGLGGIELLYNYISYTHDINSSIRDSSFSYLYYANNAGIISIPN